MSSSQRRDDIWTHSTFPEARPPSTPSQIDELNALLVIYDAAIYRGR